MTKQDFEFIARTIANYTPMLHLNVDIEDKAENIRRDLAYYFSGVLANENERFDRTKFLKACGVPIVRMFI